MDHDDGGEVTIMQKLAHLERELAHLERESDEVNCAIKQQGKVIEALLEKAMALTGPLKERRLK